MRNNISKKNDFFTVSLTIFLFISVFSYSKQIIVPRITEDKIGVDGVYKDVLINFRGFLETIKGYDRDRNLLWSNDKYSSLDGPILVIDNQGNSYQYSFYGGYIVINLESGHSKKLISDFGSTIGEPSSLSISDNYIYRMKKEKNNYFMSKMDTKGKYIWDVPLNLECSTKNGSFIDIKGNILFSSSNCLIKVSSSGKIISSIDNITQLFSVGAIYEIRTISLNGNILVSARNDYSFDKNESNFVASFDKNLNLLWKYSIKNQGVIVVDEDNKLFSRDLKTFNYFDSNGEKIWQIQLEENLSNIDSGVYYDVLLSDNNIIYSYTYLSEQFSVSAINKKGKLLWRINSYSGYIHYGFILDQLGVLYASNYKIQTSSKGLSRKGWPMNNHDPRHTNNISSPIYLKEYPNNNDHKKVICEVDNKTIDINKLTHLKKGWHLLGNSYEIKDYCPFSNIDDIYYYDTTNNKFNKININDESTHKVIPKHSGLFIYNKYGDDLTIYYDKEEILEKDKNIINKEYINTLSNGWHLLGSSDSITDMSIFKDIKYIYIFDNTKGNTLLDSESGSIKEYSGFWVYK